MRAGCGPARCSPASRPGGHAGRARRSLPGRMRGSTARRLPGWWRGCRHASRALHRPRDKISASLRPAFRSSTITRCSPPTASSSRRTARQNASKCITHSRAKLAQCIGRANARQNRCSALPGSQMAIASIDIPIRRSAATLEASIPAGYSPSVTACSEVESGAGAALAWFVRMTGQGGDAGAGVELGLEFEVVQRELADGFGVDLHEAPEVFVLPAKPLYDPVWLFAAADCAGLLRGGGLVARPLTEILDQVPVVAVEGRVRDAQCPFHRGHGGLAAGLGGLGEDTRHSGTDLVLGGQGSSHGSLRGWPCLARKAVISVSCLSSRWRT